MKKIVSLITAVAFIVASLPFSQAEAGQAMFTPCQYKNTYNYYIDRGDEYLADNQLESALESFKRALIIQPSSAEARIKIFKINQMLRARTEPRVVRARRRAIERAVVTAEEGIRQRIKEARSTTPPIRPKVAKAPARPYRKPKPLVVAKPTRKPKAPERIPKAPKREPEVSEREVEPTEWEPDIPTDLKEFYDEYLDPLKFNNGINEKIQEGGANINSGIAPSRVTGEYRLSLGFTNDDVIWKDANADYHNMPGDTSWRYIFGRDRHNSYDKKIYSRLKVDVDSPITDSLNSYNQLVIDPWTFVGKKRLYVTGSSGDSVQMDLKYWSNVRRTINETYRTVKGDIVSIQESKVHDGKTSPETYEGFYDDGANKFSVPQVEIDRMYVPIRKSWVEYNKEPYQAKAFFMASQDEALTSDDPMRLSNNKVWWEESPWLDEYDPSRTFEKSAISAPADFNRTREALKKGQWIRRQSFMARDSEDQHLTFLRGGSFDANFDNGTSVKLVAAAPRNLWDEYEQGTSLPAALRVKSPITDDLELGALYTLKAGFRHNSIEAVNNLFAIDGSYSILPNTQLLAEAAVSRMDVEESIGYDNEYTGYAAMVGLNNSGLLRITPGPRDRYELETAFTHMDDRFYPGLSNYRLTRKDFEFAKHIHFDKLNPENENVLVGDGMDVGRNAFKVTTKAEFPDNNIDGRFDFRTVHSDGGDFVENVFRGEATYKPDPKLTLKGLAYFQHLPKTTKDVDPFINAKNAYSAFTDYFAHQDVWLENVVIPAGRDPSIGAFSGGFKWDFCDYFSGIGIFETTNDPKDWPRGLFNNVYVTDEYKDGVVWDKIVPFLYDQSAFGIPEYEYYSIQKARFIYEPFDPIKVTLNYTHNENKYAMAIDDNSNHQSIEVEYKPNNRLTLGFLYQYTRQNDLYKEFVLGQSHNYEGHHNIFAALDYELNEDQHLSLMFGEYVGYPYPYPEDHYALSALDTRHIVRVAYSGTWGEPYHPRLAEDSTLSWAPLGELRPFIPGAKFVTNVYAGQVKYREKAAIVPVESGWDATYCKLEFGLDAFDKELLEGSLRFGLFGTTTSQETWNYEGLGDYQRNDLNFRGSDVNANLGWAISTPSKYVSLTPLINVGYRRIEFERSNISMLGTTVSEIGEVDEVFNVSFAGVGGRLDFSPGGLEDIREGRLNLYTSGYWAPLVYATTRNELPGRFECNQGMVSHLEGGCDYLVSDKLNISMGGFWDLQHLDRSERIDDGIVNAELPDNRLETYGLKLGGSYKF